MENGVQKSVVFSPVFAIEEQPLAFCVAVMR
jgi:hypothetical protein